MLYKRRTHFKSENAAAAGAGGGSSLTKPTWVPRCCLPHCRKVRALHNVQLYRFPKLNRSTLAKWAHNLQVPMVGSAQRRVCSAHFEPHVLSKKCPVALAVPTQDLNEPPGYKLYQNPAKLKANKLCLQRVCIVESCRRQRSQGVQLFRLPHASTQLRKWLHNLRMRPRGAMRHQFRICSMHFETHSFNGKRLSLGAIPTLELGHQAADIYPNEAQSFLNEVCAVEACGASKLHSADVRLFRFPTDDEDLLWKWCQNLKMNPVDCVGVRICHKHFEAFCVGPKHLFKWAIPTLRLGHDISPQDLITNPRPEDRYVDPIFKCCVPSCGKTRRYDEVQMNSFPKDQQLFERWRHNLNLEHLNFREREKYKICNDHFEDICIGKTRLNIGSLPTINLGHEQLDNLFQLNPVELQSNFFGRQRRLLSDIKQEEQSEQEDEQPRSSQQLRRPQLDLKCCVPGCGRSRLEHDARLFPFPTGKQQQSKWRHNLRLDASDVNRSSRVCSAHFNRRCIDGKQLRSWSMPTQQLGHDEQPIFENPKNIPGFFTPTCALAHCRKRRSIDNDLRTYRYPRSEDLLEKWRVNLRLDPDQCRGRICADHFEPQVRGKLKLRTGAVPTLKLGHNEDVVFNNEAIKAELLEKQAEGGECEAGIEVKLEAPDNDEEDEEESTSASARELKASDEDEDMDYFDPLALVETFAEHHSDEQEVETAVPAAVRPRPRRSKAVNNVTPICCLQHCRKERTATHQLSTFGFPKDPQQLRKWSANLQIDIDDCVGRVCVDHFEPEVLGTRKLKQHAVPTLKLGHGQALAYSCTGLTLSLPDEQSVFRLWSLKHCRKRKPEELDQDAAAVAAAAQAAPAAARVAAAAAVAARAAMEVKKEQTTPLAVTEIKQEFIEPQTNGDLSNSDWNWQPIQPPHPLHIRTELAASPSLSSTPSPRGKQRFCCIPSCLQQTQLFRFPTAETQLLKWFVNTRQQPRLVDPRKLYICREHFEPEAINKKQLTSWALPTLKLGHDEHVIPNAKHLGNMADSQADKQALQYIYENYCSVLSCFQQRSESVRLYPYPKDRPTIRKWAANCKHRSMQASSDGFQVCQAHFASNCFDPETKQLFEHGVPTLELSQSVECIVPGCEADEQTEKRRYFSMPKNESMQQKWCHNLCLDANAVRTSADTKYVCGRHFEPECFHSWRCLVPGSVPTLHLPEREQLLPNPQRIRTRFMAKCEMRNGKVEPDEDEEFDESLLLEPIVMMEHATDEEGELEYKHAPEIKQEVPEYDEDNSQEPLEMQPLEVLLEVGHVEKCESYEQMDNEAQLKYKNACMESQSSTAANQLLSNGNYYTSRKCSVRGCPVTISDVDENLKLHKFPTQLDPLQKWMHNSQVQVDTNHAWRFRICSLHFDAVCFKGSRIRRGAMPTFKLGPTRPVDIYDNEFCDQLEYDGSEEPTALPIKSAADNNIELCLPRRGLPRKSSKFCQIDNCPNHLTSENMTLHKFPNSPEMCARWQHNTQVPFDPDFRWRYRICSAHFDSLCMVNMRLVHGSVPTLRLGPRAPAQLFQNDFEAISQRLEKRNSNGEQQQEEQLNESEELAELPDPEHLNLLVPHMQLFEEEPETPEAKHSTNLNPIKSGYDKCSLFHCQRGRMHHGVHLYKFPRYRQMQQHWMHNLRIKYDERRPWKTMICSEHFEPQCIRLRKLQPWAVPTLELGDNVPEELHTNEQCQRQFEQQQLSPASSEEQLQLDGSDRQMEEDDEDELSTSLMPDGSLDCKPETRWPPGQLPPWKIKQCCLPYCRRPRGDGIKLFRLPSNPQSIRKWEQALDIRIYPAQRNTKLICSRHFEAQYIGVRRLMSSAVPTLNLAPKQRSDLAQSPPPELPPARCCMADCRQRVVQLHKFPSDWNLLHQWCQALNLSDVQRYRGKYICATHLPSNVLSCIVCGVKHVQLPMLEFPEPRNLRAKWCYNLKIDAIPKWDNSKRICSKHFESFCFDSTGQLLPEAAPTLHLLHNDSNIFLNDYELQNTNMLPKIKDEPLDEAEELLP